MGGSSFAALDEAERKETEIVSRTDMKILEPRNSKKFFLELLP